MSQILLDPKVSAWIKNYKTEKTREAALTSFKSLDNFLDRNNLNETDWIKSMNVSEDARYHKLSEMVNDVSNLVEPASVKQYYNFWKSYLRFVHGIKIYNEDAHHFVKPPKNIKRTREPLTHEMIKKLCRDAAPVQRAEYLVLSSSGMRMSEFLNSPKENFNLDTGMVGVAGKLTKTKVQRKTFISSEAIEAIEKAGDEFWVQRDYHQEATYFWRLRNRVNLTERYDDSIVHKVTLHSFRSFARTQAGKINQDFAEQLIGHTGYLKQYVRLTDEEMKKYYEKLEPKLRIF
ncbi:MAG TPA: hypothetical protein VLE02_05230 [Nitrosarchaeum sp.]|nr:hypothetical protein [Nitrosarchaeum sp.]